MNRAGKLALVIAELDRSERLETELAKVRTTVIRLIQEEPDADKLRKVLLRMYAALNAALE